MRIIRVFARQAELFAEIGTIITKKTMNIDTVLGLSSTIIKQT